MQLLAAQGPRGISQVAAARGQLLLLQAAEERIKALLLARGKSIEAISGGIRSG